MKSSCLMCVAALAVSFAACASGPVAPSPKPTAGIPVPNSPTQPAPPVAPAPTTLAVLIAPQPISPGQVVTMHVEVVGAAYGVPIPPEPLTYAWRFGDGATASGAVVTHAYAKGGGYPVTVQVTDATGEVTTEHTMASVVPPPAPPPPVTPPPPPDPTRLSVTLTCLPAAPTVLTPCNVTVTDSTGAFVTSSVSTAWDWGDGQTTPVAVGPMGSHVYSQAGVYTVLVTVTNGTTQHGTATKGLTIQ